MTKYKHPAFESALGFRVGDVVGDKHGSPELFPGTIVAIRSGYLTRAQSGIRAHIEWERTTPKQLQWRLTKRTLVPVENLVIITRADGPREDGVPDNAFPVFFPDPPQNEAERLWKRIEKFEAIVHEERSKNVELAARVASLQRGIKQLTTRHWELYNRFNDHVDPESKP